MKDCISYFKKIFIYKNKTPLWFCWSFEEPRNPNCHWSCTQDHECSSRFVHLSKTQSSALYTKKINSCWKSSYSDMSTTNRSCIYSQVTSDDWLNLCNIGVIFQRWPYTHTVLLLKERLPSINGSAKENTIVFIIFFSDYVTPLKLQPSHWHVSQYVTPETTLYEDKAYLAKTEDNRVRRILWYFLLFYFVVYQDKDYMWNVVTTVN